MASIQPRRNKYYQEAARKKKALRSFKHRFVNFEDNVNKLPIIMI